MNFVPTDYTFIVRLWLERREIPDLPPELRGLIEYVLTREKRYFLSMDQLTDFILEKVDPGNIKADL